MNDIETRLRNTLRHVAETTQASDRFEEIVQSRHRRPAGMAVAAAAFGLVVLLVGIPAFLVSPWEQRTPAGNEPGEQDTSLGGVVDPAWLTVDDEDLAALEELRPQTGPDGGPGQRPSLRTERFWCLYTEGPGSATSAAQSLSLDEDLTRAVVEATCRTTDTVPQTLPDTFTFCRGVYADTAYQSWITGGGFTIVEGEIGSDRPGFPVVLGWESDCVSEELDTNPKVTLNADLSFEVLNQARQLEMAVTAAAHRNCLNYDQATALADAARELLGGRWLKAESQVLDSDIADACYQPTVDLEFGAVYVLGRGGNFAVAGTGAATDTTLKPDTNLGVDELLACLAGEWTLDLDGFYEMVQSVMDPGARYIVVEIVSGSGNLTFDSDHTFAVFYESLTITFEYSRDDPGPLPRGALTDHEIVVSGEARAVFELDGNVLSVTETSGPGLEVKEWFTEVGKDSRQEAPTLAFHPGALVLGADFVPPRLEGDVAVRCEGDRLVVETLFDPHWVDAPATVWYRR